MSKEETTKVEEVNFESSHGDKKLMVEIEEKTKSGKREDIHEAFKLFEKSWKKLPNGPAHDFINSMRKNEDSEIKEKAEDVYNNSLKEMDNNEIKNLEYITESYREWFLSIQSQMKDLSRAFDVSKKMVDIAKAILTIPNVAFDIQKVQPILMNLVKFQNILNDSVPKDVLAMQRIATLPPIAHSPILRAESLFSKVTDKQLESKKSFSEILEKNGKEIGVEFEFISKVNEDFIFNCIAYPHLCYLECYLRSLIQKKIIEPYETNLKNKIPLEIINEWKSRKETEDNNYLSDSNCDLIYYSDFTDLKCIFEKGRNYKVFGDIINQEQFKTVISKLHELDPIRNKIAHSRPLSKREFDRLILYTDDISKMLSRS